MLDDQLHGAPSELRIELEVPILAQESVEEKREPLTPQGAQPEKALVEALRGFIRHESGKAETASPATIGPRQVIALVLLAADVALIYNIFQDQAWLQNPFFKVVLKVVPWVLGAAAVGYAEKLRQFMLEQARHMKWAILGTALLVPLLILQMDVFSVNVRVSSGSVKLTPENPKVTAQGEGDRLFRLVLPRLDRYSIKIEEGDKTIKGSVPFSLVLGRLRVLRGTLAQIPLVGSRFFGPQELTLSPLYSIRTKSKGVAYVEIEGQFQEGFLDKTFLNTTKCHKANSTRANCKDCVAVKCSVDEDGGFSLPVGQYYLTLEQNKCRKSLSPKGITEVNEMIDFTKECGGA